MAKIPDAKTEQNANPTAKQCKLTNNVNLEISVCG